MGDDRSPELRAADDALLAAIQDRLRPTAHVLQGLAVRLTNWLAIEEED